MMLLCWWSFVRFTSMCHLPYFSFLYFAFLSFIFLSFWSYVHSCSIFAYPFPFVLTLFGSRYLDLLSLAFISLFYDLTVCFPFYSDVLLVTSSLLSLPCNIKSLTRFSAYFIFFTFHLLSFIFLPSLHPISPWVLSFSF